MNRRQFFGAALLAQRAAHSRRLGLLSDDTPPPDFTLTDSTGRAVHLQGLVGKKRIVIVFSPSCTFLDAVDGGYNDRDLIVLAVLRPDEPLPPVGAKPLILLADAEGRVARRYHASEGHTPTFYLIGKDGTIKMARHGCPSNEELFSTIDAMPMRRREMRERGR